MPSPARPNNPLHGPLPILAACALWGTTGTAGSFAPASAPAIAVGSAGLVVGGFLLLLAGTGARAVAKSADRRLLLLGSVTVAGYALAFYPAVARTGVAVATTVALATAPIVLGVRARPALTLTAVLGCALLVLGGSAGDTRIDPLGVALAVVAGLSYAAYSAVCAHLIALGHPSRAVVGVVFGGASALVLPVLLVAGVSWIASTAGLAVVLHLAVLTTFLSYLLFGYGLRRTTAAAATTLTLAEPAVAAVLGVVVVGERLPWVSWAGMAVLALALAALTRAPRTPETITTG